MFISIIIPTFNRNDYLSESLARLRGELGQKPDAEIIVVDDGSNPGIRDRNRSLCERYNARYLFSEKNHGMAVARNLGIEQAQGEWIVFIDDDICVEKGWAEVLYPLLSSASPDVTGIEGKVVGKGSGLWDREVQVLKPGRCLTCHIVYRKTALRAAGCFDPHFEYEGPFHEDQELAVRVKRHGRIVFEPRLAAVHLPRRVKLLRILLSASPRIEKLLRADFYFYSKHPQQYREFRHAKTFWGTYGTALFKHVWVTCKRRRVSRLAKHPVQASVLVLSSLAAQLKAWLLVPYFIRRALSAPKRMKVWFAAAIPSPGGGVYRLMKGLSEGLQAKGVRTEIICCDTLKSSRNYVLFSVALAKKLLLHLLRAPDWIIARSTDPFFCSLVCRLLPLKTKIVLQNHGWEEYVFEVQKKMSRKLLDHPVTWRARFFRFPMLRATLALSDCCFCGTIDDMRWIKARYPEAAPRLRYVPNGVTAQRECCWADRSTVPLQVLCVGTMVWRKNLRYACALFEHLTLLLPEARLMLVGTGASLDLKALAGPLVRSRITVVAAVAMQEMASWYKRCPFLLHVSRYEGGHALALLEAMSFGAVPFVSPIPSNREIVRDRENGIVLGCIDAEKDAAVVAGVIEDGERRRHISRRAYGTAMRNRWERQAGRLARVIGVP
ncbi:MAG: glycosyltransferase [Chitinispirillaceae bacterium]|nr:glycosyltransferase [Chitinispirillaceae bacterium]